MVSNTCLGGGALWICRGQDGSFSAGGRCSLGLGGLVRRCGEAVCGAVSAMGNPHHPGHTLQIRVGLPFAPRGLKTCDTGRRRVSLCFMRSGGKGFAGLSRRWSGRCLPICLLWVRELNGRDKGSAQSKVAYSTGMMLSQFRKPRLGSEIQI